MTVGVTAADGVLRMRDPDAGTRWLATGHAGAFRSAPAAYLVSVPDGFERTDPAAYADQRRARAGFGASGPALLTGVDLVNARGARAGEVVVVATAGLSNPAVLPMTPLGDPEPAADDPAGTVNLLVRTARVLDRGTQATLLTTAVEAETATLHAETGFTGTTSDAVVVGCDPAGATAEFAGSGTALGADTRACVREAVRASLDSRYAERSVPESVADADHGARTDREATVFVPDRGGE